MMVFPLMMVIGSPLSGYLTDRGTGDLGLNWLSVAVHHSADVYVYESAYADLYYVVATAIMGLAIVVPIPNNTMVMSSVTKENLGVAGSLNSLPVTWAWS